MAERRISILSFYTEEVLPALAERLDQAFPEFGWTRDRDGWIASNQETTHRLLGVRADRVVAHGQAPQGFLVHGVGPTLWTAYVTGGDPPRGQAFVDAVRQLAERAGLDTNEFRADLEGDPPTSLALVPSTTKEQLARVREIATALRRSEHAERYVELADQVENDLNLAEADIDAAHFGAIDTFRFEERRLLARAVGLTLAGGYDEAIDLAAGRAQSFWLDREVARQAQWEACRLAAELGREISRIDAELVKSPPSAAGWIAAYERGWFEVDRLQRRLATWIAQLDDEPAAERAIAVVRLAYDELLKRMAIGFGSALAESGWSVPGVLPQTSVYPEAVQSGGSRLAFFLVDALRYEMGVELRDQLQGAEELAIRPAVAMLPTITPVGMAALLPGASASFSVVESKGKLAARVEQTVMPSLAERMKFLKAKVPAAVDFQLDKLLSMSATKLKTTVGDASLVIVRSQEIDLGGELDSDNFSRHVMDTVIGNIARAARKLATAGIESFVVTADHGHQFAQRKEDDMRIDAPGGDTVGLHRRCWIGRGGTTPAGTIRVSSAELGYDSDLDFVFPTSLGVFKAGGGLTYHHGGTSLQEMVVPLITFRIPPRVEPAKAGGVVHLADVPDALTNRVFSVRLTLAVLTTEPMAVRVVLLSGTEQVGQAGMVAGAELDRDTGIVTVKPGTEASVGVMLTREDCETVRLVVQDPATDAVLGQSDEIPREAWDMTITQEQIPLRDELDDKVARVFAGKVVRKDLVRKVKVGANVPVFVLEYLLGKYCASSDEMAIRMGMEVVNKILAENYIRPDESTRAQSAVKENGRYTFIDKVKVRLVDSRYWADVTNFGHKHVHIPDRYVRDYDRLLTGGIWAQVDMRFEYDEEEKGKNPFWIETLTPIQLATFDVEEYQRLRAEFTTDEWLDLLIRSMGYEPSMMDRRLKLLFLVRLIPLCERNYNLIELGPRGTGKSYALQELSPYTALLTGQTTVANLGHMSGREKGMVMIWDVVGFDEIADLQKMPREVITTLKTYCESGQFQRGREAAAGYAGIAMFGNTDQPIDVMVQTGHLFAPLPDVIRDDMAFIDRLHFYLPGWEVPKMRNEHFTDHYGFVVDYLAEALRELRKLNYTEIIDHHFSLGTQLNARDRKAVRRTVSGLMKILHPHGEVSRDDLEEILALAVEGRRRVKEQLKKMGSFEYHHTSFSYSLNETGEERFVGVPEQGGRDLISIDPLAPGSVYAASVANDGTVGLYRLEVSLSNGTGKLKPAGGVSGEMKESVQRAFSYLLANKVSFGVGHEVDTSDFHVEAINLLGNKVSAEIGVAFFVAAYSSLRRAPVQPGLLVLGDMSIQGNLKPVRSLVEPLQVAMDNGARRALIPIENKRNFLDVSSDVLETIDPIFFGDLRSAGSKALGLN